MLAGPFDQPGWTDYLGINFFFVVFAKSGGITSNNEHRIFSHNIISSAFITDGNLSVSSDSDSENESVASVLPSLAVPESVRSRAFVIRPPNDTVSNQPLLVGSATPILYRLI